MNSQYPEEGTGISVMIVGPMTDPSGGPAIHFVHSGHPIRLLRSVIMFELSRFLIKLEEKSNDYTISTKYRGV